MPTSRRDFLAGSAALGLSLAVGAAPLAASQLPQLLPPPKGRRAVVVGGGWGGLSAARHLRDLAPDLEVVLLEKNPAFWSCPLSNKWLANLVDTAVLVHDYTKAARAYGYTFIQAEVAAIDRDRRRVVTAGGTLAYDWLVLAVGIRYDFAAWFGDDRRAIDHTLKNYPCAYVPGSEAQALKKKLDDFKGGDLVMTLPPLPYRCPPSPYERACAIGWLIKSRRIKGKLIVLDPNPLPPAFSQAFGGQYREQIDYVPHARVKSLDPFNRKIVTDFEDIRFDDAIIMAPQQAGDLVWQAGLVGRDGEGRPTGWVEPHPVHLHARDDERVFVVGDALGKVSPLFGQYPKSGQMASRQGRIVAHEIAARAKGVEPARLLPDSACYVYTDFAPQEMLRIDAAYRFRGDGEIVQTGSQSFNPQPQDEDVQWAKTMFGEFLAYRGG